MKSKAPNNFHKNVFINCPFDKEYKSLLRPLLFTIIYFGFNPRLSSERSDSLEQRVEKILALIKESRYSIHDLSRLKSKKEKEFSRLNMPFELGVDYGCRRVSTNRLRTKKCLILEQRLHGIKKALSDLAGVDIKNHNNNPAKIPQVIQHWFIETVGLTNTDSPSVIWDRFNEFTYDFFLKRKAEGYARDDLKMMPMPQYIRYVRNWIASNCS
jgi:hypothetical protein